MSEAVVAQIGPYAVDVKAGKDYYWCRCGLSQSQPFCDGSHKVTEFTPERHTAGKTAKAYFCGCKRTGSVPICDGSHKGL